MKKLMISMLAMAAMVSCTSEDILPSDDDNQPVEIKATAGISEITTKSTGVIQNGDVVTEIGFIRNDGEGTPTWSTATLTGFAATIAADGVMTFTPAQYYDSNAKINTYLIGYHPNTGTRTNNEVVYTITGQEDIMCTALLKGDKTTNKTTALTSIFDHLLTQLSFKIKADDQAAIDAWGNVTSIELINQQTTATLTLDTKTLVFSGDATNSISIGSTSTAFDSTPTTEVAFGQAIMVQPGQSKYTVKVKTANNTEGIDVDLTVDAAVSTSYVVTLTFKGTTIGATATIGTWKTGTGEGTVQ